MQKFECVHYRGETPCINHRKCRYAKDGACTVNGNLESQSMRSLNKSERKFANPIYKTLAKILLILLSTSFFGSCTSLQIPKFVSSDPIYFSMIPDQYKEVCKEIKKTHGFSYKIIFRLVNLESGWNSWAVGINKNGTFDQGLCQLNSGNDWKIDVFDPVENLKAGFSYLGLMLKKFNHIEKALIAYNCGPGRVIRGNEPERSKKYALKILGV